MVFVFFDVEVRSMKKTHSELEVAGTGLLLAAHRREADSETAAGGERDSQRG